MLTIDDFAFAAKARRMGLLSTVQMADALRAVRNQENKRLRDHLVDAGVITRQQHSDIETRLLNASTDFRQSVNDVLFELACPDLDVEWKTLLASGFVPAAPPKESGDDPLLSAVMQTLTAGETSAKKSFHPESSIEPPLPPPNALMGGGLDGPQLDDARYRVLNLHAQGNLGRVWLARDERIHRNVAIKDIQPRLAINSDAHRRFIKEARVTGQLEHPDIVPVHDMGPPEHPYYVMRLLSGRTLSELIAETHRKRRQGTLTRLERQRLLEIFIRVCQAIAFAHSRGVIHRDLKPANVNIGSFGEVCVLDWGLAKIVHASGEADPINVDDDPASTLQGAVLGTPSYMSPEQASGRIDKIDARSDVYSLGAILFEILTGESPHGRYSKGSTAEFVRQVAEREPPKVRYIEPAASPIGESICAKALARSPDQRYPSAEALGADVHRWIAGEPVAAHPESRSQRLARWAIRHKRSSLASAGAILAIVVVATALLATVLQHRDTVARVELGNLQSWSRQVAAQFIEERQLLARRLRFIAQIANRLDVLSPAADGPAKQTQFAELLSDFMNINPHTGTASVVATQGETREVVRVERRGRDRTPQRMPPLPSTPNANAGIIAAAMRLPPEDVFIGPCEHTDDAGRQPVPSDIFVRTASPIYRDGKVVGVVLIEFQLGTHLEDLMMPAFRGAGRMAYAVDETGNVFLSSKRGAIERMDVVRGVRVTTIAPELGEFFTAHDRRTTLLVPNSAKNGDIYFGRKIYYTPDNRQEFLGLVFGIDRGAVHAESMTAGNAIAGLLLAVIVGVAGLALFLFRLLARMASSARE